MCTRYPIINRVSELKVHIELTRFVQPEKIEIDANERAVNKKSQYCFFVCTTFDSFLNDLSISLNNKFHELTTLSKNSLQDSPLYLFLPPELLSEKPTEVPANSPEERILEICSLTVACLTSNN